jgi:hypothetical protein
VTSQTVRVVAAAPPVSLDRAAIRSKHLASGLVKARQDLLIISAMYSERDQV